MSDVTSEQHVVPADRWLVQLEVPEGIGDFGLHTSTADAAANFRAQLREEFGEEIATRYGPDLERDFQRYRSFMADKPILWSGFVATSSPKQDSEHPSDADSESEGFDDDMEVESSDRDVVFLALQVGITELTPMPEDSPISVQAAVGQTLKSRYGADAGVDLVDYGEVPGVASVRMTELPLAGTEIMGRTIPADTPPAEQMIAEVVLLFVEQDAVVTVQAATPHDDSLYHAIWLAGSIAQRIQVREIAGDDNADADGFEPEVTPPERMR